MNEDRRALEIYRPLPDGSASTVADFAARLPVELGLGLEANTLRWGLEPRVGIIRIHGEAAYGFYKRYGDELEEVRGAGSNGSTIRVGFEVQGMYLFDKGSGFRKDDSGRVITPRIALAEQPNDTDQIPVADANLWDLLIEGFRVVGANRATRMAARARTMGKIPLTTLGERADITRYQLEREKKRSSMRPPEISLGPVKARYYSGKEGEGRLRPANYGLLN